VGIIAESTTAPGTKHKGRMSVGPCDSQYPMNTSSQEVAGFRLANGGRIWSGARKEAQEPRMPKRRSIIGSKDGNIG